ncbi:MAG: GNAT family N-acetyltransferase [Prevotella sp.]|jgi:putative acetyltransferase|nr:GNAT family N-acetyltransferase [Prevotella sp.]
MRRQSPIDISIREAKESDTEEITQLFYETIQSVNIRDYSQEDVDDWSSWYRDTDKWKEGISSQFFIVAIYNSMIVGFGSLAVDGYLDFMFIHKDFQRRGIAAKLLEVLEEKAISQNNKSVYSEVSITARGFFESHGYKVVKQQLKKSRDRALVNYIMFKEIISNLSIVR